MRGVSCWLTVLALASVPLGALCKHEPTELSLSNFREQTASHPISYVFFYTKKGKEWEENLDTFKQATELLLEEYPGMLCGIVDLDENSPLTLYTKYNSVDLMIFYPDFVPTPLRYHGTYSPEGILENAKYFTRYTNEHMLTWVNPKEMVDNFMQIEFKGRSDLGNSSAVVDEAKFHAKKMNIYLEYLQLLKKDVANLVEVSNSLRFKLHNSKHLEKRNEDGVYENEEQFLDQKMRLAFADDFLQHMFPKKKLQRLSLKTSPFLKKKEEDHKRRMILDAAARAAELKEEAELM